MESIKKEIEILISKYLENKCTQEEKHEIVELLTRFGNERLSEEVLISQLNGFQEEQYKNDSVDFERIYNELLTEIQSREAGDSQKLFLQKRIRLRRLVLNGLSIAAVFCIAFFLGIVFNRHHNKIISSDQTVASSFVEIKAPLGARSEVRLNDNTEVMLNAGSSIRFSNNYNSLNRDLTLEGEAYFKVAKNTDLPLIVKAGNINIKATGTEFNVKAYSDEGIIETTLVKGEVEISQKGNNDKDRILILKPNQKAIYTDQTDKVTLERIKEIEPQAIKPDKVITDNLLVSLKTDVEQQTAWTKKKLIIKGENLETLCTKLERKYDVTFAFRNEEIKKHRFNGVLLDETFEQVMDAIKLTAPVDYIIDGKTVFLFSNKEKTVKYSKNLLKNQN
jgi:transmembrane sensor